MKRDAVYTFLRYTVTTAIVAAIVFVCFRLVRVNATAVALSLLIGILLVSANWGLRQAVYMSVLSALAFNFFFLPPLLTFTIRDSQNWIALFAFLTTGIVASQLAERARRETASSHGRQREVERLYEFSQRLLTSGNVIDLLTTLPLEVAQVFNVRGAALYIAADGRVYQSASSLSEFLIDDLRETAQGREQVRRNHGVTLIPIRLGVRPTGALGIAGAVISPETLNAISGLIAIAIERAGAVETLGRSEAARESERLRNALLDSVTHELRTPLTSIMASITSLRSNPELDRAQSGELMAVIQEETERLNRLIGQAVEMARLETEEVKLELAPHSIAEAVEKALSASTFTRIHPVEVRLPESLPQALMDPARIVQVLQHLVENAAKYSPADAPIVIAAEAKDGMIITSVADRGVGIDEFERGMIFDKFYRGQSQRHRVQGTGMGLAIAKVIVEAHGGTIAVTSQPGQGSVFSFSLHAAG